MRKWFPGGRGSNLHPELWLGLLVIVVFGPFVQTLTAQPAARYALTAAVYDRHTVDLRGYTVGVDRVTLPGGRLRSDKAPGQPFLAVPAYAVGRAAGMEPATRRRIDENLSVWWVTLWSTVLPLALLLILMRRVALSLDAPAPTMGPIAIVFAGLIAAFASQQFGSVLAGLLAFAAWYALRTAPRARALPWFVGGLLVGAAVITEYTAVLIAVVFAVFVVIKAPRRLGWYVAGGVPPAIIGAVYNQIAFGSPWKVGYASKGSQPGILGISVPKLDTLVRIFVADRGLVTIVPITIVAVIAAILLARGERGPRRTEAIIALVVFGLFLAVQAGWPNPWGGDSPGPRYMLPAFPFLAAPLAVAWKRLHPWTVVATVWGALCMTCAVIVFSLVTADQSLFSVWRTAFAAGDFVPTVWTMAFGPFGSLVHVATIVVCVAGLRRALPARIAPAAVSSPHAVPA